MKYLVSYNWNNLKGNHAGFPYFCNLLQRMNPKEYCSIVEYSPEKRCICKNFFLNRLLNHIDRNYHRFIYNKAISRLLHSLKEGDVVILAEYLHRTSNQIELAKRIRNANIKISILGVVHLPPSMLSNDFTISEITEWAKPLDAFITLGSSLSGWLYSQIDSSKVIHTLFHPVDRSFFHPISNSKESLSVIAFGRLLRNLDILEQVISLLPNVSFTICSLAESEKSRFNQYPNVINLGFISESALLYNLRKADISLNVMDDTIGSNVITISMAMGLAVVVSDVGSIRDYCTDDNAIFCNSTEDYVNAISLLTANTNELERRKKASLSRSSYFSIEAFDNKLASLSV